MSMLALQALTLICLFTLWYWAGRYGCLAVVCGIVMLSSIYVALGDQ
jgi:hypothetical protein